jgi:hypothetical protein
MNCDNCEQATNFGVRRVLFARLQSGRSGAQPLQCVEALGGELDSRIVACDGDVGEPEPYPDIKPYQWTQVGKARFMFIPKGYDHFGN